MYKGVAVEEEEEESEGAAEEESRRQVGVVVEGRDEGVDALAVRESDSARFPVARGLVKPR